MVGDRFGIDQCALRKLRHGDDDAAGPLTVRSAGDIVSCSASVERRDRLDSYRRLGEEGEEFGEFGLHLGYVAAKVVENLLRRSSFVFGISFERCAERGEVREALFFCDCGHLGLDAVDFAETELVDLVRSHVGGRAAVDVVLISLLAGWERGNGKSGPAVWGIFGTKESSEGLVGGDDIGVNSGADLLRQTLLLFWGDASGVLLCRMQERIGSDDALALNGDFLEEKAHGHKVVLHAGAEDLSGLTERAGDLVKPGYIVFIVLH